MKIELIERKSPLDANYYYILIDGKNLIGSGTYSKETAEKNMERIKTNGTIVTDNVIQTIEI